jgi:hypothetical protein
MKRLFLPTILLLLVASGAGATRSTGPAEKETVNVPLRSLLIQYGHEFSIYFTLETDESSRLKLLEKQVAFPRSVKDKVEFVALLQRSVPEITVTPDASFPEVIHVWQNLLAGRTSFMEKPISLQYQGTFRDFLEKVISESNGALAEDLNSIANSRGFDGSTQIRVDVKDLPVRTAMCAALPRWSNPLIWTAFVGQRNGQDVTFFKAAPSSKPSATATAPKTRPDTLPSTK